MSGGRATTGQRIQRTIAELGRGLTDFRKHQTQRRVAHYHLELAGRRNH